MKILLIGLLSLAGVSSYASDYSYESLVASIFSNNDNSIELKLGQTVTSDATIWHYAKPKKSAEIIIKCTDQKVEAVTIEKNGGDWNDRVFLNIQRDQSVVIKGIVYCCH